MDHIVLAPFLEEARISFRRAPTRFPQALANKVVIVCMIALVNDFWLRIGVLSQTRCHHFETLLAGKKRTTPAMARAA
jgi:hypothetical protein